MGRRAFGVIDDAPPDRWRETVIRFVDKPLRRSVMELVGDAGRMERVVPWAVLVQIVEPHFPKARRPEGRLRIGHCQPQASAIRSLNLRVSFPAGRLRARPALADPNPPARSPQSCRMASHRFSCFASTQQPLVTSHTRPKSALGAPLRICPAGPPWTTGLRRPTWTPLWPVPARSGYWRTTGLRDSRCSVPKPRGSIGPPSLCGRGLPPRSRRAGHWRAHRHGTTTVACARNWEPSRR
jgi:hypothetical protein